MSIGDVADRSGLSRRTVRYYVQRELIDPPDGLGRGSAYSAKHLDQIARIVRLQREGMPLEKIQDVLANGGEPPVKAPRHGAPNLVMRIPIAPGIRIEIDCSEAVPTPDELDKLAAACGKILKRNS
ncbi:MAG: MerR family transcriptional regulator [Planctomycetota bacterium]